jgi:acetyl-CoA carboxylase alpha subunit
MMDHARRFTRPLLTLITDHGCAFADILATRAEQDPALADHMLAALADLEAAFPDLAVDGAPQPVFAKK